MSTWFGSALLSPVDAGIIALSAQPMSYEESFMTSCQELRCIISRPQSTAAAFENGRTAGEEMNRTFRTALVLVLLIICGCSPDRETTDLSEEDQIRETVFRYQFDVNVSGLGDAANAYFLSVEGDKDPSAELLKQFEGHHPPVKPVSASTLEPGTAQVLDRESGLPGLAFRITEIRWLADDEVEVDGGYEEASESGSGNTYRAMKRRGQWEVVEHQMLWIK
jgi:hypothetical protein